MNLKILDEIVRVDDKECFLMTRDLVRQEGLYVGGSSGAAVAGAIKYAEMTKRKENILVLLPDSAQKYLSKIFNDEWMRENGFLDEPAELQRLKKKKPLPPPQEKKLVFGGVVVVVGDGGFGFPWGWGGGGGGVWGGSSAKGSC